MNKLATKFLMPLALAALTVPALAQKKNKKEKAQPEIKQAVILQSDGQGVSPGAIIVLPRGYRYQYARPKYKYVKDSTDKRVRADATGVFFGVQTNTMLNKTDRRMGSYTFSAGFGTRIAYSKGAGGSVGAQLDVYAGPSQGEAPEGYLPNNPTVQGHNDVLIFPRASLSGGGTANLPIFRTSQKTPVLSVDLGARFGMTYMETFANMNRHEKKVAPVFIGTAGISVDVNKRLRLTAAYQYNAFDMGEIKTCNVGATFRPWGQEKLHTVYGRKRIQVQ